LHGVLEAVGAERMVWPRVELEGDGDESLADAVQALLLEEWAALSSSTLMLAAAGAELVPGGNELGAAAATQRAELHTRMLATLREKHHIPPYVDLPALVEMLSAALTAFALRAEHGSSSAPSAQSFDAASPQGWRRIEKVLAAVTRALLDSDGR
jgi:hypothetical protein